MEDLSRLAIGAAVYGYGYLAGKYGFATGTDAWLTKEQKFAADNVQGAPQSYNVLIPDDDGGTDVYSYLYLAPFKGAFAIGADDARRDALADQLTEEQKLSLIHI